MRDNLFVIGVAAALTTFVVAVVAWLTVLPTIGLMWTLGVLR